MASTVTTRMSADEFWALPDRPDVRIELVDGEVIELPGGTWLHADIVIHIFTIIHAYVRQHGLGRAYADGLTYLLLSDPDTMRIPDISFIPQERIPESGPTSSYARVLPALVVEVVSLGNTAAELRRRTRDYIEAGVSLVWIVWPDDQTVSVHAGSMNPTELTSTDTLDGGDVLPGFTVTVAELFDIAW